MTLEQIQKSGFKTIAGLEETRRRLWESACKHDNIEPTSRFVVFSDDNPYTQFMAPLDQQIAEAVAAHVPGGGYVGLKIANGRATV